MNKRIKKKWIKALRSGKYKQGKMVLHSTDNKFCCLGVLCDLYVKEKKSKWVNRKDKALKVIRGSNVSGFLPPSVQKWAGMDSLCGSYEIIDGGPI